MLFVALPQNSNENLFGRETEIEVLEELLLKTESGVPCLAFISGPSGVGKTTLVKNTMNFLTNEKNIFIYSKFNEFQQNNPYYPFVQLIRELIRFMLAAPKEETQANKKRIEKIVGNNIEPLYYLIPELKYVFGNRINTQQISPQKQQECIKRTFFQIVREFSTKNHPIILFIDDLQWADEGSLNLLDYFCCNFNIKHIFLICAFRGCPKVDMLLDKVQTIPQKNFTFKHISVNNFTYQQTFDFVFNYFDISGDYDRITRFLYKKTLGNPFHISQIRSEINKKDSQHSLDCIQLFPNDIIQLITNKIAGLPDDSKKAIKYAAIIGNTFSLDILSQILGSTNDDVLLLLDYAFLEGLIIPTQAYNEFEFVHDKFREQLIQMVDNPEQLHLIVGRELLHYYKSDKNYDVIQMLLDILHHFMLSVHLINDNKEKLELARYFSVTGKALLKASAYTEATKHFDTAFKLIAQKTFRMYCNLTLIWDMQLHCSWMKNTRKLNMHLS